MADAEDGEEELDPQTLIDMAAALTFEPSPSPGPPPQLGSDPRQQGHEPEFDQEILGALQSLASPSAASMASPESDSDEEVMGADSLEALVAQQDDNEETMLPADPRLPDPRQKAEEATETEKDKSTEATTTVQVVPNIRKLKEKLLAKKAEAEGTSPEKPKQTKDEAKPTETQGNASPDDKDDKKKKKKEKKESKPGDHLNDSAASELLKAKLKAAKQLLKRDSQESLLLASKKRCKRS